MENTLSIKEFMHSIRFRELKEKDIPRLQEVAIKSWMFAYRDIYIESRIRSYVGEYYSTDGLKMMIRGMKRKKFCFQIALDKEKLIGYVNGGRRTRTSRWELFRIYLLPEYIGFGIGKELLRRWEKFLIDRGARNYSAYIHFKNKLAKEFYLRNGFVRKRKLDRGSTSECFLKSL